VRPYEDAECKSCGRKWVVSLRDSVRGLCPLCGSRDVVSEGGYLERCEDVYEERVGRLRERQAYEDSLPRCRRCGRLLTHPLSQKRGYGFTCWLIVVTQEVGTGV